jgi:hypothetical protein
MLSKDQMELNYYSGTMAEPAELKMGVRKK